MDRPKLEVADVFRRYGAAYRQQHGASMSTGQLRVMSAIEGVPHGGPGGAPRTLRSVWLRTELLQLMPG